MSDPSRPTTPVCFYYGWLIVALAALAMVATLPGRTQGLGLVTESLLADLKLNRVGFAQMNLWATLLGALFCLPTGRCVDQFGARTVLTLVALALGAVVFAMSRVTTAAWFFLFLVLSRALGQNALSIVSLTLPGQWFSRRLSRAMAIYSIALSIGFMAAFPIVGSAVREHGWRLPWAAIGLSIAAVLAPLAFLLTRRAPSDTDLARAGESTAAPTSPSTPPAPSDTHASPPHNVTWRDALRTPAFWVFALASSIYNLVASGIGLFNESILVERGFDAAIYHHTLVITALTSLVGNFLGGWLATRWSLARLMTLAMSLLATALVALPSLTTLLHVYAFALVMGLAGGFVIVLFFTAWAQLFGRLHLGRIQGTAQMLTVLASAVGPLLLAQCHAWTGSYATIFYVLAAIVALLALAAWRLPQPNPRAA